MNVLVIGASGQLGGHIFDKLQERATVFGTYNNFDCPGLRRLDITKSADVAEMFNVVKPEMVFLTAAATNVDWCQENSREAYKINVDGVKNVVNNCGTAKLIFFSTDFVFDGVIGNYSETDSPNPINEYGFQKLLAEHYIMAHAVSYRIIRTNCIYGPEAQGSNFISRLIANLRKEDGIATIPYDEWVTPTYGPNLADASIYLAFHNFYNGIVHLAGKQIVNRYAFALKAAKIFDCDDLLIKPVTSKSLKRKASRPLNGGLRCTQHGYEVDLLSYEEGLAQMKRVLNGK